MSSEGSPSKKQKTEQSTKMASAPEQFQGFMIHSKEKWSDFTKEKVRRIPDHCMSIHSTIIPGLSRLMSQGTKH
jgi:hypothetical protein